MAAINNDWAEALKEEYKKPYYRELYKKVNEEYQTHEIFPPASLSGASLISGAGLFSIGLGILAVLAVIYFCKWIILGLAHLIQNMSRKRSVN